MGNTDINQIKSALIRRGIPDWKLRGLSDEQLRELSNEKLCEALTGSINTGKFDKFIKNYEYNILYSMENGEKVQVHKLGEAELASGRKIEVFIDVAGNQYFQFRAANNQIIKDSYFKKQEKFLPFDKLVYRNNNLYKEGITGYFTQLKTVKNDMDNPTVKETSDKKADFSYKMSIRYLRYYSNNHYILIKSDGKVDLSQYSLEFLLQKYHKKSYNITNITPKSGYDETFVVTNKSSGNVECTISHNKNSVKVEYEPNKTFVLRDETLTETIKIDNGFMVMKYKDNKFTKKLFDKNNKILVTETGIIYNDEFSRITSPCLNNLHNKLHKTDIIGSMQVDRSVIKDIIGTVYPDNYHVLNAMYYRLYGTEIDEDIVKSSGLGLNEKLDLFKQMGWPKEGVKYLAENLKTHLKNSGNFGFEEFLKKYVDKDNIDLFIKAFAELRNFVGESTKHYYHGDKEEPVRDKLCLDISVNIIQAINKGNFFSNVVKQRCLDYIIDTMLESPHIQSDIKKDIIKNRNNIKYLTIDVNRAITRYNTRSVKQHDTEKLLSTLDKKSFDFSQGPTGDCWLISVLISVYNKNPGILNSMLTIDKNTKEVTVNLKGVNKTYTFSVDELLSASNLNKNDLKVRAFEMAVDRYHKEDAYENYVQKSGFTGLYEVRMSERMEHKSFDIWDNSPRHAVEVLFGVNSTKLEKGVVLGRFNFDKNCYIFIVDGDSDSSYLCKDIYGQQFYIIGNHDYAILKADEECVYLVNPWYGSNVIQIPWNNLKDTPFFISYFSI